MDITELIKHPELMDRDTLYELRSILALYPTFQTARLLMLQNLFILHDPSFDEELRRAAISITDRRVIFNLVEASHYKLPKATDSRNPTTENRESEPNRTISLIDDFLDSMPKSAESNGQGKKRKPTPADAAVDYVAYLLETEGMADSTVDDDPDYDVDESRTLSLIDNFIENEQGRITLQDEPKYTPQIEEKTEETEQKIDETYVTETFAHIYIKQKQLDKALDILQRVSQDPEKNTPFVADQIRFLKKLIILNKNK